MGRRILNTCKDCPDRHEACHDHCEKYLDARAEWIEYKDKIYQAKEPTEHDKYKFQSIKRYRKWREWHDR